MELFKDKVNGDSKSVLHIVFEHWTELLEKVVKVTIINL
jgi:hypothetical protein